MSKQAIIVHGWGADSQSDWFPWLKNELEQREYIVIVPDMPNTDEPIIEEWVGLLKEVLPELDENTILIGHSIGCQAIMRYLSGSEQKHVGKIIFVASWFNLVNMDDEEMEIAKPWIETAIDFEKIKNSAHEIIALFSDNDPVVPLSDVGLFSEKLGAMVKINEKRGHFNADDGHTKLPEILKYI